MLKPESTFEIRPMLIGDIHQLVQLKSAENWNQTEQDWVLLINQNPDNCLVACYKNSIIGTVTTMAYNNNLAWIGMMLVSKEFRGKGVSKLLLYTLIDKLHAYNSIKLDATPAGFPVYKKIGFKPEYEICRMTKLKGAVKNLTTSSNLNYDIVPITKNNLNDVVELDAKLYGVNRLALFQFMLKQQNNNSWCIKKENTIHGYVLGRKGSQYFQIGPILAQSTSEAKVLLTTVFQKLTNKPILVDVLKDQYELINWLTSIGFNIQRTFTRMYLKNNACDKQLEKQFLIAGPELS